MKTPKLYNGQIFEHKGLTFRVQYEDDVSADYPWESSDGHGPVRKSAHAHGNHGSKAPGERPMNHAGRNEYQFYYDWAAACKLARADGWNVEPYGAPNRIARAVQADFDFLSGYVNGQWGYVGVNVELIEEDEDGEYQVLDTESLWGVETFKDYHETVGYGLADELATRAESRVFPVAEMGV